MKRKYFITIALILICASSLLMAQTWSNFGTGLSNPVNSIMVFDNNVYAASYGVAKWNGTEWLDISNGLQALFGSGDVYSIAQYNSNLFAGGSFTVFNPENNWYNNAARYNGSSWTTCGSGLGNDESGMSDYVNFLLVYNNELYAGGNFMYAGGGILNQQEALYIARFNGAQWLPVGSGMNDKVTDMIIYDGELVVSGLFTNAGGVSANHIAKWNGTTWFSLGSGMDGKVTALAVHNGELYAGGLFNQAGGVNTNNIAKWNGQSWSAVGSGINGDQVYTLASFNSQLYAGGNFTSGSGNAASYFMCWDGSQWNAIGSGVDGPVIYLCADNSRLIIGGNFSNAGGVSANNIAYLTYATSVDGNENIQHQFYLKQNYPNPFNPTTMISWQSPVGSNQTLKVYDVLGNEVATLVDEYKPSGNYEVEFQSTVGNRQLASGVYYYQLTVNNFIETKKFVLMK